MTRNVSNEALLARAMLDRGIKHFVFTGCAEDSALLKLLKNAPDIDIRFAIDERNAAYYAMGIAIEANAPAAVIASDGTGASNYLPAATEAFYQGLPLLMIEERTAGIDTVQPGCFDAYRTVAGCVLSLAAPDSAETRCRAVDISHALSVLENNIFGRTPVFISYEKSAADGGASSAECDCIDSLNIYSSTALWESKCRELEGYGAAIIAEENVDTAALAAFAEKFGCRIIAGAALSAPVKGSVPLGGLIGSKAVELAGIKRIITLSRTSAGRVEALAAKGIFKGMSHWHIAADGFFYDPFRSLDTVFCCEPDYFLRTMASLCRKSCTAGTVSYTPAKTVPNATLAELVKTVLSKAGNSCVQFSVCGCEDTLNSIDIPGNVRLLTASAGNVSTGCLSIFMGFAYNNPQECYLIIDDKSFFKDMNALAIRHVGSNAHILLVDTGYASGMSYFGSCDHSDAADSIESWMKDVGAAYISVGDGSELPQEFFRSGREMAILARVSL